MRTESNSTTEERFGRECRRLKDLSSEAEGTYGGIAKWRFEINGSELQGDFSEFTAGFAMHAYARNLRKVINEPLTINERIKLACGIAESVMIAHRWGVHRDIKPENILVDHDLKPHLGDFGIAAPNINTFKKNLTKGSVILGTPRYMSYEQLESPCAPRVSSDLYSLGLVLYELFYPLSKHPAEQDLFRDVLEVSRQHKRLPPPLVFANVSRRVSDSLNRILAGLLEHQPSMRIQSAKIIQRELVNCLDGRTSDLNSRHYSWIIRNKGVLARGVVSTLLLGLLFFAVWAGWRSLASGNSSIHLQAFAINELALAPSDNHRLAFVNTAGVLQIIDPTDGSILAEAQHRDFYHAQLNWSEDGSRLAIGARSGRVYVWDAKRNTRPSLLYDLHRFPVLNVAWSPNDQMVASIDRSGHALAFEFLSEEVIGEYQIPPAASGGSSHGVNLLWEPDSKNLILQGGGWGSHFVRWNPTNDSAGVLFDQDNQKCGRSGISVSPNGRLLATSRLWRPMFSTSETDPYCVLEVYELGDTLRLLREVDLSAKVKLNFRQNGLAWANDESLLAYTDIDITRIDLSTDGSTSDGVLNYFIDDLALAEFSEDQIVGLSSEEAVRYDTKSGTPQLNWKIQFEAKTPVLSVDALEDGFVVTDSSGRVYLWLGSEQLSIPLGQTYRICSVSVSPSKKFLITGGTEGQLTLFDVTSKAPIANAVVTGQVSALEWRGDERQFGVGTAKGHAYVFNFDSIGLQSEIPPQCHYDPQVFGDEPSPFRVDALRWSDELLCGVSKKYLHGEIWRLGTDSPQATRLITEDSLGNRAIISRVSDIVAFSKGGFLVPSHYGAIALWPSLEADPVQLRTTSRYSSVRADSIDSHRAVAATGDGGVWLVNAERAELAQLHEPDGVIISDISVSKMDSRAMTIDKLGRLLIFDLSGVISEPIRVETGCYGASSICILDSGNIVIASRRGTVTMLDAIGFSPISKWSVQNGRLLPMNLEL